MNSWEELPMALKKPEGDGRLALNGAKILQLSPAAPGWWVRYRDGRWTAPIVAWALAETEEGWQHIYGVDPSGDDFQTARARWRRRHRHGP
jgi:hypothetical protein